MNLFNLRSVYTVIDRRHQSAKKVVSNSLGLVDFAIGLVISVLNLPNGQVKYFEEFNLQKNCKINSAHQKILEAIVEMTFGPVNASFSLPEWQAVKMTFFAPWAYLKRDQLNKTNTILIS